MTKLYYPKTFFDESYRWHIFPLLKELIKSELKNDNFQLCDNKEDAEVLILPMSWNYYYSNNTTKEVLDYLSKNVYQKPIISFVFGDVGNKVPYEFKGVVLRTSGDKSKLPIAHCGLPVFIPDPLRNQYQENDVFKRIYSSVPTVGFCGLANKFSIETINDLLRVGVKNLLSNFGFSHKNPQRLMSAPYFRYNILSNLQNKKCVKTNFIIRNQYRAGIKANKNLHHTTEEFYNNIKDSDYILCMRGAGNFSTRFYETLAMGRIPVFVNTDCLLPLEDKIDWKQHVVWVEYKDRHHIEKKIIDFHSKLDENSLNMLFESNRQLWINHLQVVPYFKTLFNGI